MDLRLKMLVKVKLGQGEGPAPQGWLCYWILPPPQVFFSDWKNKNASPRRGGSVTPRRTAGLG